ncbi:hypothetical protein AURDEDRAFT_168672 [Auricularia subglabra TFB-10046 SS5]|nr:hypothetical protein AURDEDRAFT_168672 [Auricularia subglabra TFB-10046 SS5]
MFGPGNPTQKDFLHTLLLFELPALEELNVEFHPGLPWPPPADVHKPRLYSKLRTATMTVWDFADILDIVNTCPDLRALTVRNVRSLGSFWTRLAKPRGEERFPSTLMVDAGFSVGSDVMTALQDTYFPDVTVHYGIRSISAEHDLFPFFRPFASLTVDDVFLLAASAPNGDRRAIVSMHHCLTALHQIRPVSAYLPAHAIVSVTVDVAMWSHFAGIWAHERVLFPSLAALTIVFSSTPRRRGLSIEHQHLPPTAATFPALRTLRVEDFIDCADRMVFSSEWLASFVTSLALAGRLEKIELPGRAPRIVEHVRTQHLAEHVE